MARRFFKAEPRLCIQGTVSETNAEIDLNGTQMQARKGDVFVLADWEPSTSLGKVKALGLITFVTADRTSADVVFRPCTRDLPVGAGRTQWNNRREFLFDRGVAKRYNLEETSRCCFGERLDEAGAR